MCPAVPLLLTATSPPLPAPAAADARAAAADSTTDLKHGAKKASIRAESTVEEGKEKGRSWLARMFGRGKVRKKLIGQVGVVGPAFGTAELGDFAGQPKYSLDYSSAPTAGPSTGAAGADSAAL